MATLFLDWIFGVWDFFGRILGICEALLGPYLEDFWEEFRCFFIQLCFVRVVDLILEFFS